jgi:hypothetical protein
VFKNAQAVKQGAMVPLAVKARALYRSIAAIDRRISTLQRAQQQRLSRMCCVAQNLLTKHGRVDARKSEKSRFIRGRQALLLAVVAAAARFYRMSKAVQSERHFAQLKKNSAAASICQFLKSLKGVIRLKQQAHITRQKELCNRSAAVIIGFFKLFLPRMKRLRRARWSFYCLFQCIAPFYLDTAAAQLRSYRSR